MTSPRARSSPFPAVSSSSKDGPICSPPAGSLSRVADFLKSASRSARITAQPPIQGSRKAALALSGKRAERVRDYLVGEGVTAQQVIADPPSATPTRPLPNSPEFATNGAVDIVLVPARGGAGGGSGDR